MATLERERSAASSSVPPLLAAAATAALAVCAHDWAVGHVASDGASSPVRIAAVVGLSAVLGGAKLPFLVRVALHLGMLWILQQFVGTDFVQTPVSGFFFVSTAAFFAGAVIADLSNRWRSGDEEEKPSLRTGDLITALFAFSAYVAVGQHAAGFWNHHSTYVAELTVLCVVLPYAALILLETLLGRAFAAVSLCLATIALIIVLPEFSLIDPFATALIVALRIVGRPLEAPDLQAPPASELSRTPVPPAA